MINNKWSRLKFKIKNMERLNITTIVLLCIFIMDITVNTYNPELEWGL
ncbi:hypothetical protein ACGCUP_09420 [Eubacteriales bacterium KG125]